MKIVVLVKHVPDATGERAFAADGTVDRESTDGLLSELDEYAVEQALRIAEEGDDVEVVAMTLGPDDAADAIKRSLQMGASAGIHINDDAVHGTDAIGTSTILAAAIRKAAPDLVVCGMASTDGSMGVLPSMIAERLGWPAATLAAEVSVSGGTVTIRRDGDTASLTVEAPLPAVVSVTDQSGEARYPSMKGILAAKKKPVETWALADLEVEPSGVGLAAAWSKVISADPRPPKEAGRVVPDEDGSGSAALVEFLAAGKYSLTSSDASDERQDRMAEVLVVVEHVEARSTKPTCELVTLARRLGDPVAVVFGEGAEAVAAKLGEYGATRVLAVTDPAIEEYLVAPKAEALAQIAGGGRPGRGADHLDRRRARRSPAGWRSSSARG